MAKREAGSPSPDALITCETCDYSVAQSPDKKRTICPNCGHFYTKQAAEVASTFHRGKTNRQGNESVPQGTHNRNEQKNQSKSRSGGRISSFFRSSKPNSAKSDQPDKENQATKSSVDLDVSQSNELLPPIDSRSHLVNSANRLSYSSQSSKSEVDISQGSPRSDVAAKSPKPSPRPSPIGSPSVFNTDTEGKIERGNSPKLTAEQLKAEFVSAKETGNWKNVLDYYTLTFDSFVEINAAFKKDRNKEFKTTEDPGLKFYHVSLVYDILIKTPHGLQKEVLKSIINSLLKDKRPHSKDDLRAFLVLVQNPQFLNQSTYVIFAHLLRQMAALNDHDHHYLVHWMKGLKKDRFHAVVTRIHLFISVRLFPPKPEELPPLAKCSWWIPSATKVLALFNAANNLVSPPLLNYTEFYNSTLDHLDLMAEYYAWQNPSSHAGFSFCQYPFILSIAAKRTILQKDSEQQMIIMARKSLVAKVQRRQLPDIGMLFLNLTVRRSHLVSDSLNEIAKKQHDLKKKLKVSFSGEPGLDMGGLTKEWFLLLVRQIFMPNYGMFSYDKTAGVHWFSPNPCDNYQEFNLVGVLMGLAVYNSINLDIRFPPLVYRKLLCPAVVPFNNPQATVGVCPVTIEDLKYAQPAVAKGLKDLLDYQEDDVEDIFCLNFEATMSTIGGAKTSPLKPNGENIPVTKENKAEYVQLYIEWILNVSIYAQFQAFYHGFHSVCASNALIMLRPEEVETLVCGSPKLVMEDLKKVTVYDGYNVQTPTIRYFWDVVLNLPRDKQKRLLLFATGSDRIPIGGISEMTFKISRIDNLKLLPMSHTCFNQLVLPPYKSKKVLKQKLMTAICNAEGFGLE